MKNLKSSFLLALLLLSSLSSLQTHAMAQLPARALLSNFFSPQFIRKYTLPTVAGICALGAVYALFFERTPFTPRTDTTQPPCLWWKRNDCWVETALHMLFAMPEVYDGLKAGTITINPDASVQKRKLIETLIPLLAWERGEQIPTQIDGQPYAADKHRYDLTYDSNGAAYSDKFYRAACAATEVERGDFGTADELLETILYTLYEPHSHIISTRHSILIAIALGRNIHKSVLQNSFVGMPNDLTTEEHPQYIFLRKSDFSRTMLFNPLQEISIEKPHPGAPRTTYRLVASAHNLHNSHWIAYTQNHREEGSPWYRCYGMNSQPNKIDTADKTFKNFTKQLKGVTKKVTVKIENKEKITEQHDQAVLFVYKKIT
ncbi:MAG: hypothetical protein UU47_C0004G0003 [candidate division TM6 bacterium GW2011_GWE2_41_16]|nr:MAG: hypothetical protein UU47_C0004G0003 [candidate division TM6 bacterium GW2011_GWE2_41_16]